MTAPSRLAATFAASRAEHRSALVTYVMAGDPDLEESTRLARACIEGGADIVELGIPFSDPLADGPVIQRAAHRALRAGTRLGDVLGVAAALREESATPIVLMGYLNPILAMGEEAFFTACHDRGVDAVMVPDLCPRPPARSASSPAGPASASSSWSPPGRARSAAPGRSGPRQPSSTSRRSTG